MRVHPKFLFTFLVAFWLINSIGIPVYYHYCGGELESVSALFKSEGCCGEEDDEENGCCANETKIFSQHNETRLADKFQIHPASLDCLPALKTETLFTIKKSIHQEIQQFPDPCTPEKGKELLIQHSVFRI